MIRGISRPGKLRGCELYLTVCVPPDPGMTHMRPEAKVRPIYVIRTMGITYIGRSFASSYMSYDTHSSPDLSFCFRFVLPQPLLHGLFSLPLLLFVRD